MGMVLLAFFELDGGLWEKEEEGGGRHGLSL